MPKPEDAERYILQRLTEMDEQLTAMEPSLPDDMRPLGAEARRLVAYWLARLAAGGANLEELTAAMTQLTDLMSALTNRLLLKPWDGARGPRS
jgi:hypothetical protein